MSAFIEAEREALVLGYIDLCLGNECYVCGLKYTAELDNFKQKGNDPSVHLQGHQ